MGGSLGTVHKYSVVAVEAGIVFGALKLFSLLIPLQVGIATFQTFFTSLGTPRPFMKMSLSRFILFRIKMNGKKQPFMATNLL